MSNALLLKVVSWLIPVISPLLVSALKAGLADKWDSVPSWLKPLISALIGAVLGVVTGDPAAVEVSVGTGAVAGLAGSGLYDVAKGARKV